MNPRAKKHPNFKKIYYAYPVLIVFTLAITTVISSYLRNQDVGVWAYIFLVSSMLFICVLLTNSQNKFLHENKCYDCDGETTLFEAKAIGEKYYAVCDKCKIQWDLGIVKQAKSENYDDYHD